MANNTQIYNYFNSFLKYSLDYQHSNNSNTKRTIHEYSSSYTYNYSPNPIYKTKSLVYEYKFSL